MRIGISLPLAQLAGEPRALVDLARCAEDLGFAHVQAVDTLLPIQGGEACDPLTLLAAIAARTCEIELVTAVLVVPTRSTLLLAKQTVDIDRMSNGRLRLGIGVGRREHLYRAMESNFPNRGRQCEMQIAQLRALWRGDDIGPDLGQSTLAGVRLNPLPVQRPIPIWYGPNRIPRARVRERIARYADGWFAICPIEQFSDIRADIEYRAQQFGRTPNDISAQAQLDFPQTCTRSWRQKLEDWRSKGVQSLTIRAPARGTDPREYRACLQDLSALLRS